MAVCISQYRIKRKGEFVDVPCGRCGICLQNKRKEWSFRLQKEWRYHEESCFLTLTYSDSNLVYATSSDSRVYAVLHKPDYQLFMKRLRKRQKALGPNKLKYYAVGEYGSKTRRPHFHAIMFGLYNELHKELDSIWGQGHSQVGTVTLDSIDYVTKYVVNKPDQKHFLVPPFSLISNGIGLEHFHVNKERYRNEDVVHNSRGYPQRMPRYYREKQSSSGLLQKMRSVEYRIESERERAQEVEKLASTGYENPEEYMWERELQASDRILKAAKKGGIF